MAEKQPRATLGDRQSSHECLLSLSPTALLVPSGDSQHLPDLGYTRFPGHTPSALPAVTRACYDRSGMPVCSNSSPHPRVVHFLRDTLMLRTAARSGIPWGSPATTASHSTLSSTTTATPQLGLEPARHFHDTVHILTGYGAQYAFPKPI